MATHCCEMQHHAPATAMRLATLFDLSDVSVATVRGVLRNF